MKKAYDDLLAVEDNKSKKKKAKKRVEPEEDLYDDDYDDEGVSMVPIIVLGIAIIVAVAVIAYMLLKK